jgi:site-specific recombinase XerC
LRVCAKAKAAQQFQRREQVSWHADERVIKEGGSSQQGRRLGMRDRALLGVLVTCALRCGELSRMNSEHLAMRDRRWVFLDFKGKGYKTRIGGCAAVGEARD